MAGGFREEPLFVDFRWAKNSDQLSLRHTQFRSAILDLASTIRGIPKDELDGNDVRQHRRARRIATAAILFIVASAGVAGWQAYVANQQRLLANEAAVRARQERDEAQRQREAAERQARIARSREISASALGQLDVDPELGMLLAIEATAVMPTPQAEDVLRRSLVELHLQRVLPKRDEPVAEQDGIKTAAFSPDNRSLATTDWGGRARIWDVETGRLQRTLTAGANTADEVLFSNDGRFIVTAANKTVRVWDAATGRKRFEITDVVRPEISSDSMRLVVNALSGAHVWDLQNGNKLRDLDHPGSIEAVHFSRDGNSVVTSGAGGTIVWDALAGTIRSKLPGDGAQFDGSGGMVVTRTADGVSVWEAETGKLRKEIPVRDVFKAQFDPKQDRLALEDINGTRFWNLVLNDVSFELPERDLVFSPDGRRVANTNGIWDSDNGQLVATLYGPFEVRHLWAAFSPDGRRVVTTYQDGTARIWSTGYRYDAVTLRVPTTPELLDLNPIGHPIFSPDASRLITSLLVPSADGEAASQRIAAWSLENGRLLWSTPAHIEYLETIVVSPDGTLIAAAGRNNDVRVWDAQGRSVSDLKGHTNSVTAAEFAGGNKLLVTTSYDSTARVWDPKSGRAQVVLNEHVGGVHCATFNPAGTQLLTCDAKTMHLWDTDTGRLLRSVGEGLFTQPAFSSSGRYLITKGGRANNIVTVWDPSAGTPLKTIEGAIGAWMAPNERWLATIEGDSLRIHDWRAGVVLVDCPERSVWSGVEIRDSCCRRTTTGVTFDCRTRSPAEH